MSSSHSRPTKRQKCMEDIKQIATAGSVNPVLRGPLMLSFADTKIPVYERVDRPDIVVLIDDIQEIFNLSQAAMDEIAVNFAGDIDQGKVAMSKVPDTGEYRTLTTHVIGVERLLEVLDYQWEEMDAFSLSRMTIEVIKGLATVDPPYHSVYDRIVRECIAAITDWVSKADSSGSESDYSSSSSSDQGSRSSSRRRSER